MYRVLVLHRGHPTEWHFAWQGPGPDRDQAEAVANRNFGCEYITDFHWVLEGNWTEILSSDSDGD